MVFLQKIIGFENHNEGILAMSSQHSHLELFYSLAQFWPQVQIYLKVIFLKQTGGSNIWKC